MLNTRVSFKDNAIFFKGRKYADISYTENTYSENDVFRSWYIRLAEFGIKGQAVVVEVSPKKGHEYIELSQFLIKNNDVLIAITGSGLFEMKRIRDTRK